MFRPHALLLPWLEPAVPLIHRGCRVGECVGLSGGGFDHLGFTVALRGDVHGRRAVARQVLAHHRPAAVASVEPDCDRRVGVLGPDEDPTAPVVAEGQVRRGPGQRGLDPLRVAAEPEAMRCMGYVHVAAPKDCVVERGGELADAAAEVVVHHHSADDGRRLLVALLGGSLSHIVVEPELTVGRDDGTIDFVGDEVDVVHPGLAAAVICGELGDEVLDPESLELLCGHLGFGALAERKHPDRLPRRAAAKGVGCASRVDDRAGMAWLDAPSRRS